MAIHVPTAPNLSARLQKLVAQLAERNGQINSTTWTSVSISLWCHGGGFIVKDFWISAPAPGVAGTGGFTEMVPWNGIATSAAITPTTTASQCDTIAATMIAAIKAHIGPVFLNV